MTEYHKIQTVFLRSPESNFKTLMEGQWAPPEFDMLKDIPWVWTEKIDGTNIRILWNGTSVTFGGKTDAAMMPTFLLKVLQGYFYARAYEGPVPRCCECLLIRRGLRRTHPEKAAITCPIV